mmetsp:Transcript_7069/g.7178  ORF Transcript_7069/g.7178 Transcript_7069/m.7178 type:complete len:385 (-) Transcript_7069:73-1227(-)
MSSYNNNDIGEWLGDFFRSIPSLTTKPGIGRTQMESIYSSVAQFQSEAPWRIIDNSFPMRISVRTSLTSDDWTEGSIASDLKSDVRIIPSSVPKFSTPSLLFGPHRPSTNNEITKYCLVAGNTDYGGRGLYAYDEETPIHSITSNTLYQLFCLQIYDPDTSSTAEMRKVREWNLPTNSERKTNIKNILKVFQAPHSLGPRYKFRNGNTEGLNLFRNCWSSLPDAKQMRWMDAALRAIVHCASEKGIITKVKGLNNSIHLGYPAYEVEMRFPSWTLEDSPDRGKRCYAYVKVLIKKSYDLHSSGAENEGLLQSEIGDRTMSYYPGGHVCYFCGSPKFCSSENPEGKLQTCSRCRSVKYCKGECQKKDWKRHKRECKLLEVRPPSV